VIAWLRGVRCRIFHQNVPFEEEWDDVISVVSFDSNALRSTIHRRYRRHLLYRRCVRCGHYLVRMT
jgi:hypothetical protein